MSKESAIPLMTHESQIVAAALVEHRERIWSTIQRNRTELNYRPKLAKAIEDKLMTEVETTARLIGHADRSEFYRELTPEET